MKATESESDTKLQYKPQAIRCKLSGSVEGAEDNQCHEQTTSSQLTRNAHEGFQRCADIKLVCVASPTSKSLNQVVRNAVASCYRGCPNAEAVTGKIVFNPHGGENFRSQSVKVEQDRG